MIKPGMHVIVGISGGADSVCLLYVLKEYRKLVPCMLTAVHVEHGIRGGESMEDARFTEELCGRFQIPFHMVQADVTGLAAERKISLEEAGRVKRYEIFEQIRRELGAQRIAVAHNQNDQAETVLWNLVRGSGLTGLGGIRPVRGNIIRPLLFTQRREIEEILKKGGLTWRTDRSNLEQVYTRNRIRLSILPQMEQQLNARSVEHIAEAAERLQQVQQFVEHAAARGEAECIHLEPDGVYVELPAFLQQEELIQRELLRRAMEKCAGGLKDLSSVHVEALLDLCSMDCGHEIHLPGGIRGVREYDRIRFARMVCEGADASGQKEGPEIILPHPGSCSAGGWRILTEFLENDPSIFAQITEEKKYTKCISYDTIKSDLLLRTRRPGDYLEVNEAGGRKKLKDYFIDQKIPREQRDQTWLLADGSHILWVVGYRISEGAKVRPDTKKVLKIHLEEEKGERESQNSFTGTGSGSADCRDRKTDQ